MPLLTRSACGRASPWPLRLLFLLSAMAMTAAKGSEALPPEAESVQATAIEQLLQSAELWEREGRPELARVALEKVLRAEPGHPEASLQLGDLELRSGAVARARELLEALRARHPGAAETRDLAARINSYTRDRLALATVRRLREIGDYDAAAERLREIFPDGAPPGPLGIEYWSTVAFSEGGMEAAVEGLRRLAEAHPDDRRYRLALADIMVRREATRSRGFALLQRLARPEDDVDSEVARIWSLGLGYLGDLPRNADALRAYLRRFPQDEEIAARLAVLDARLRAERARQQDPVYRLARAAEAALQRGDLDTAASRIDEALAMRPDDPAALGAQGALRMWQQRYAEAKDLFRAARRGATLAAEQRRWAAAEDRARFRLHLAAAEAARALGRLEMARQELASAEALQAGHPDSRALAASITAAGGDAAAAEAEYRALLEAHPGHRDAVDGLLQLFIAADPSRIDAAVAVIDRLSDHGQQEAARRRLATALREQARQADGAGKGGVALRLLERAVALAPGYPWARHDLARRYVDLGLPGLARQLMREGLEVSADDEMRFALVLVLAASGDEAAARRELQAIPFARRSESMQDTLQRLQVADARRRAERAHADGDAPLARHWMSRAEAFADGAPERLPEVALGWVAIDLPQRARALLPPESAAAVEDLTWLEVLEALEDDEAFATALAALDDDALSPEQREGLDRLLQRRSLRLARQSLRQGDAAAAFARLDAASQRWPENPELPTLAAQALQDSGRERAARQRMASVVERQPRSAAVRLAMIDLLVQQGRRDAAWEQLPALRAAVSAGEAEAQLVLLRAYLRLDARAEAADVVAALRAEHPDSPETALAAGLLARAGGRPAAAMRAFADARARELALDRRGYSPAQAGMTQLLADRDALVSAGLSGFSKPGRSGVSEFNALRLPLEWRLPWQERGDFILMSTLMRVGAGRLAPDVNNAGRLGSVQPRGPAFLDTLGGGLRRQHEAADLALAWEGPRLRADIGVSAFGFPVTRVLGSLRWSGSLRDADYEVGFVRRAVTGTVLAYAGVRDPATGRRFGGVTRTGFEGRIGRRLGRLGLGVSAGAYRLDGRQVQDNTEIRARLSADWRLWRRPTQELDVGGALLLWHFDRNLEEFTLGHGGYFSPQGYVALSLPAEWRGRQGRWSWRLAASVAVSYSESDAQDFFPNRPDLQAAAAAQPLPPGFDAPVYDGDSGAGFSGSLRGAVERAVGDGWQLGADFDLTRAEFFTPSFLRLYLRRDLGGNRRGARLPPRPPRIWVD